MASSTASSQTIRPLNSTTANTSGSSFPAGGGRHKSSAPPNGANGRPRPQNDTKSPVTQIKESNTPDKHADDRMLFLLANFVGNTAYITLKTGEQFTGIFSAVSLPKDSIEAQHYVLKMAKRVPTQLPQVNSHPESFDEYIGHGENHSLVFDVKDVIHVNVVNTHVDKVPNKITNGTSGSFRTDTDISGNTTARERELQRWEPTTVSNQDMSLAGPSNGSWDQFETNERLYGVTTNYDESFYTTTIDRSAPSYRQRAAAAEKLAREIEGTSTTNTHMAEERGQVNEGANGMDEEDKFSGVKRDFPPLGSKQPTKYTPPARRAPTSHSTTAGAPVDPAIISAQPMRSAPSILPLSETPLQKENMEPMPKAYVLESENVDGEQPKPERELPEQDTEKENSARKEPEAVTQTANAISKPPARAIAAPTTALPNATANVETEVLKEFRSFAAREKMNVNEQKKQSARKDREMKLNDLKSFATTFKLKTAVPVDMLGILAKDKQKQVEIVEKSQRQLVEQHVSTKSTTTTPEPKQKQFQSLVSPTREMPPTPPSVTVDRQTGGKGSRGNQHFQNSHNGRSERGPAQSNGSVISPKSGPGNLGQRLMQQPQYRDRGNAQSFSGALPALNTFGTGSRNGSIPSSAIAMAPRFNVQASEFRPNPSAVSFSPTGERAAGIPTSTRTRRQSSLKTQNRSTFFPNGRPRAADKKSIKNGFNPILRMKDEAEAQNRTKDYSSNGGIPQAYRTPPTWDTSDEFKEKSYVDMFDRPQTGVPTVSPVHASLAHQHQLPLHLQQGMHGLSLAQQSHQSFPQHSHGQGRDHRFDDHRMQLSASQSSQFPSPRMPAMTPFGGQVMTQNPSQLGQATAQFPYPGGQGVPQMRHYSGSTQFIATPGGPLPTPMIINPAGVMPYIGPIHTQSPMFSPAQGHVLQNHMLGGHSQATASGFNSPRGATMMVHQGSQQGHVPPPHFYMNTGQHPGHFYGQHQGQPTHMRGGGGIPMTHQQSFNSHLPQHFPGQQRQYSQFANSLGHQAVPMDPNMSQQQHQPPSSMNANGDNPAK